MVDAGIRHLPVVDGGGRVIGVISIDDLRGALPIDVSLVRPPGPAERQEARDYAVSDAMTWAPRTARASDPLEEAARSLAEHRIGCLPVVDEEGRLDGILSETDALHALEASLRRALPPVDAGEGRRPGAPVDALWEERERLIEQLASWQGGGRGGEESHAGGLESLVERASRRLRALDRALEHAEQGRFGRCERCRGRIPATRLKALPETTLCVRCARTMARAREEI
jgi:CBS domain-containing protein